MRESPSLLAFPAIIALHAIGMGLLVGANAAMDFRILGFASGVPISSLERLVPVMRFGFWLNATSGLLLLLAYPTKALTNPVFYTKIFLIVCAMVDAFLVRTEVIQENRGEDSFVSNQGQGFGHCFSVSMGGSGGRRTASGVHISVHRRVIRKILGGFVDPFRSRAAGMARNHVCLVLHESR